MEQEKREQIKIGLLGVIALALLYQTGAKLFSDDGIPDASTTPQNQTVQPMNPVNPVNPINPAQQQQQQQPLNLNPSQPATASTTVSFSQTDVNLGTLQVGAKAEQVFKLTNTGSTPLKISNVTADMGVQVLSFPTTDIPPGGNGDIKVEWKNDNPPGTSTKTIHVNYNAVPSHQHLTLTAEVK